MARFVQKIGKDGKPIFKDGKPVMVKAKRPDPYVIEVRQQPPQGDLANGNFLSHLCDGTVKK